MQAQEPPVQRELHTVDLVECALMTGNLERAVDTVLLYIRTLEALGRAITDTAKAELEDVFTRHGYNFKI